MKKFGTLWVIFAAALLLNACKSLNPSRMLMSPEEYVYSKLPEKRDTLTRLSTGDEFTMQLFSNDGFKLVDLTQNNVPIGQSINGLNYRIDYDGTVKLPILGRTKLSGLNLREAELFLEEKYSTFYIKPFVILAVTNRKIYFFPGADGSAKVIPLNQENMTLIQGLAIAGGIAATGKADRVKLIRGSQKNPQVYLFDLSTLEGFKNAEIVLESNDIIYIEPTQRYARGLASEFGPYITLLTSVFLILTYIDRLSN